MRSNTSTNKNDTSKPTKPATTASITFKRHKRRRNSASRSCSDPGIGALGDGDDDAMIQVIRFIQTKNCGRARNHHRIERHNLTRTRHHHKQHSTLTLGGYRRISRANETLMRL
jgi:hypothetical protein